MKLQKKKTKAQIFKVFLPSSGLVPLIAVKKKKIPLETVEFPDISGASSSPVRYVGKCQKAAGMRRIHCVAMSAKK